MQKILLVPILFSLPALTPTYLHPFLPLLESDPRSTKLLWFKPLYDKCIKMYMTVQDMLSEIKANEAYSKGKIMQKHSTEHQSIF